MVGIGGLIEGVIACNEWVSLVMSGNRCSEIDHAVLRFFELLKQCFIKTGIRMPILNLPSRHSMKIKNDIKVIVGVISNDSVQ